MIDSRELRNCFGKFATGVTIITTRDADGGPVGLTVNSFSSLSLDPPLILWSLDNKSPNRDTLEKAAYFGVSVLAADQIHLSQQFATAGIDKFHNVKTFEGETGVPLIAGTVAHFECRSVHHYAGGDHVIYVGEVEHFDMTDKPPLLYANGTYAVATRHPLHPPGWNAPGPHTQTEGPEADNFIIPLLRRAYWQLSEPFYQELVKAGTPINQARILVHMTASGALSKHQIAEATRVDIAAVPVALERLCALGYLEREGDGLYAITEHGAAHMRHLHERAAKFEAEVFAGYDEAEIAALKAMLNRMGALGKL